MLFKYNNNIYLYILFINKFCYFLLLKKIIYKYQKEFFLEKIIYIIYFALVINYIFQN